MVIKEWQCNGCGLGFDSEYPVCGRCGAAEPHVIRVFRTAPGFKGDKTKLLDTSLQNFTKQYGLSDFSNNPSTKHEKNFDHLWKDASAVVSAPDADESKGDLIKSIAKEAAAPITTKKIIVAKDKQAVAQ